MTDIQQLLKVVGGQPAGTAYKKTIFILLMLTVGACLTTLVVIGVVCTAGTEIQSWFDQMIDKSMNGLVNSLDEQLESYREQHGRYPDNVEDLWSDLPDGDKIVEAHKELIDSLEHLGKTLHYCNPSQHDRSKPDLWIFDKKTGRNYSNW